MYDQHLGHGLRPCACDNHAGPATATTARFTLQVISAPQKYARRRRDWMTCKAGSNPRNCEHRLRPRIRSTFTAQYSLYSQLCLPSHRPKFSIRAPSACPASRHSFMDMTRAHESGKAKWPQMTQMYGAYTVGCRFEHDASPRQCYSGYVHAIAPTASFGGPRSRLAVSLCMLLRLRFRACRHYFCSAAEIEWNMRLATARVTLTAVQFIPAAAYMYSILRTSSRTALPAAK